MTTLELAKIVHDNKCEINIRSSEIHNFICIYVTARNKDKVAQYAFDMEPTFSDSEEILDYTIKMCISQIKDTK